MEKKLKVGVLGATGMVGQRFITLLADHPWYEVTTLAASPRSAGKTYEEAVGDRWKMTTPMPEKVKNMIVHNVNEVEAVASTVDFVFSAVDMSKDEIKAIEEAYAKTETPVVSNNSAHRWTPDVPMVVPEINPEHYEVIKYQKERLGTKRGFVAVKPNCSIQSYAPVLTAWKEFEPTEVVATTYQAISGAGKTFKDWPEMVGNIIPFIEGKLFLKVNRKKTEVAHISKVKYLGYTFYRYKGKCRLRVHAKSVVKMKNKIRELTDRNKGISNKKREKEYQEYVRGWVQYYRLADMKGLLKRTDEWARRRIRAVYWKQWKKIKTRYRMLKALGMEHWMAKELACSRKGYWRMAQVLNQIFSKKIIARLGYTSMSDYYLTVCEN